MTVAEPHRSVADEIFGVFAERGGGVYFGEGVTQTEHALQAAYFAAEDGLPEPLILAALLHDVGHLVVDVPDDLADWVDDARHEVTGAGWLASRFGAAVSEPVRLHVPAKRYLCATDPAYLAALSPASVVTLGLQGGPMPAGERARFESEPYHRDALRVRRCDDRGKVIGLATPTLMDHRPLIERLARRTS
jgi:phosphonate degradation associated HDIG domain protein